MANWNPIEKPYRVTWSVRATYPMNWQNITITYATYDEAKMAFDKPSDYKGLVDVAIDLAENAAEWQAKGKWKRLNYRKRFVKGQV